MPKLRTYRLFICHAWDYNEDYHRLVRLLDAAPNFQWENRSVPEHDPIEELARLEAALRDQMRPAHAFLVLAGMYVPRRDWLDFEIKFARRIGQPIIGVIPRGQERIPQIVDHVACEMVHWNTDSIVSAIRRHALKDD